MKNIAHVTSTKNTIYISGYIKNTCNENGSRLEKSGVVNKSKRKQKEGLARTGGTDDANRYDEFDSPPRGFTNTHIHTKK